MPLYPRRTSGKEKGDKGAGISAEIVSRATGKRNGRKRTNDGRLFSRGLMGVSFFPVALMYDNSNAQDNNGAFTSGKVKTAH